MLLSSIHLQTLPHAPVLLCFFVVGQVPLAPVFGQDLGGGVIQHPSQLFVRFRPSTTATDITAAHAAAQCLHVLHAFHIVDGLQLVQVPDGQVATAVATYAADPNVLYAEPDYLVPLDEMFPNDSRFAKLWGLHNSGQTITHDTGQNCELRPCADPDSTKADADIDAPQAWLLWQGDPDFRIAVVDSGVDYNHPDFFADANGNGQLDPGEQYNIWINPGEDINHNRILDGTNGCNEFPPRIDGDFNCVDDDNDGYVDDLVGYDFIGANPLDPIPDNDPMDSTGHGTHVAGIIAAVGDNKLGVTGVNWRAKIVPLRICTAYNERLTCSPGAAAQAIEYCVDHGIRVSNHSWGGRQFNQSLYDCIARGQESPGHLVVAAAGNCITTPCNRDNDGFPHYPSSYDLWNVIAVAATNNGSDTTNEALADFSNYGRTSVDLGAPGDNILSTFLNGSYAFQAGTSMAAPHVTGVVALVWSRFPSWTYAQVRSRVLGTVREIPALNPVGNTPVAKGGVVNAYRALAYDCNGNGIDDATDISSERSTDAKTSESDCCIAKCNLGCTDLTIWRGVCEHYENGFPYFYCCVDTLWDEGCAAAAAALFPYACGPFSDELPDECISIMDCNLNRVIDDCDIDRGTSRDCDANGVPDECSGEPTFPPAPQVEPNAYPKNRYISFIPGNAGQSTAIRIKLVSLGRDCGAGNSIPYKLCTNDGECDFGVICTATTPTSFENYNGQYRYVAFAPSQMCQGGPKDAQSCVVDNDCGASDVCSPWSHTCVASRGHCTNDSQCRGICVPGGRCRDSPRFGTFFGCAKATCQKNGDGANIVQFEDWSGILGNEVLHVTGSEILPSSVYEVQILPESCRDREGTCREASCALTIETSRWGDVAIGGLSPGINVLDINAVVDKLMDLPAGTFIKPKIQVQPNDPVPTANLTVLDVAYMVDAVKSKQYPFDGPRVCP